MPQPPCSGLASTTESVGNIFAELIDETYLIELKVIVQLVRWYEIGLVTPGEIDKTKKPWAVALPPQ